MTDDVASKASVEITLTVGNLPHAVRELLRRWRELAQTKWSADRNLPDSRVVQLHVVAHAAAVAAFLEDDDLLRRLFVAAESYFNDPQVTRDFRRDDTWFHTRARAVDVLLDEIERHTAMAQADGRLSLDDPAKVQHVAEELVDLVVAKLSLLELSIEVLVALPPDFDDAQHRVSAAENAKRSIMSKLGAGEPTAPIAVLESMMRGLGHESPTNLTSVARKLRRVK